MQQEISGYSGNLYQVYPTEEEVVVAFDKYMAHKKKAEMIKQVVAKATRKQEPLKEAQGFKFKDYHCSTTDSNYFEDSSDLQALRSNTCNMDC